MATCFMCRKTSDLSYPHEQVLLPWGVNLQDQMFCLCQLWVWQTFLPLKAMRKASMVAIQGITVSPTQDKAWGSGSASATESCDGACSSLWLLWQDEHQSRSRRGSRNLSHLQADIRQNVPEKAQSTWCSEILEVSTCHGHNSKGSL